MFLTPGSRATRYRLPWHTDPDRKNWALRSGSDPQGIHLYRTYTDDNNWMAALIDWNTNAPIGGKPTLTFGLGLPPGQTGNLGTVFKTADFASINFMNIQESDLAMSGAIFLAGTTGHVRTWAGGILSLNNDTNINRPTGPFGVPAATPGIMGIGDFTGPYYAPTLNYTANGYYQWGGQARVTGDVSNSTTTLADATGLSVTLKAGRTYSFEADLSITAAATGGIQVAMSGSATATAIVYDGWIVDGSAGGIVGNAQSTALDGVVATSTITGTTAHVVVKGGITVNAGGTLKLQFAQNTSNATATIVKRGSYLIAQDMP